MEPAAAGAVAALEEFAGWLRRAGRRAGRGRDPRLGRRLWEAKLWHTLDTELTAAEVLRRARDEPGPGRARRSARAAAELVGGRADDDTVRAALNRLADEHPDERLDRRSWPG